MRNYLGYHRRQARVRPRHLRGLHRHYGRQVGLQLHRAGHRRARQEHRDHRGPGRAGNSLHPVSAAFVNNDGQQCGYCTSGFVMAAKGFLDEHPNPTMEDVKHGLGGNLCRCGTYMGVRQAALEAAAKHERREKWLTLPITAGRR